MGGGYTLMTIDLRLNDKETGRLRKAKVKPEDKMSLYGVEWNIDNSNKILGCFHRSLIDPSIFYLIKTQDDIYRLIGGRGKDVAFYIIDDIEKFVEVVGVCAINIMLHLTEEDTEIFNLLDKIKKDPEVPAHGIITIEEGEVFIYEQYYH